MKKILLAGLCVTVFAAMSFAVTPQWVAGNWAAGVTAPSKGFTIDKLGAHQNGGRGCVGCHTPHSGGRGNGGVVTGAGVAVATTGVSGDEVLWGQDLTPVYGHVFGFPVNPDDATKLGELTITELSPARQVTGIAMCLSCHDGNVAKGAMMVNKSFEQAAGMLPASYGLNNIPTLLGNDGGSTDNYKNDHPVGPSATLGTVGHGSINASKGFFALAAQGGVITQAATFPGSTMSEFYKNYGSPTITQARKGAGFATDISANLDDAYVVCTTCHTPHSMYTTSASPNGVPIGTVPTFFFVAAPYNPGANVADGLKASSATQFCRQCHFTGPGGANEGSGISIPTAY